MNEITEDFLQEEPDYDKWFDELKAVAISDFSFDREAAETFDKEAYKLYWQSGYRPKDAIKEDLRNA